MKIILISGLSGSGKSVALKLLEDVGYYCVDNMPVEMLPDLVLHHIQRGGIEHLAVSVDIRSGVNIEDAREKIAYLRSQGHQVDIVFLEASQDVLVRRFSETRRSHPLAGENLSLLESLQREREWLFPLRELAYCIDTSFLNSQQLRHTVQQWLQAEGEGLQVILESFGFKYGVPSNVDFVFDMRSLPNPHYDTQLRPFNGRDKEIQDYLDAQAWAQEMLADVEQFLQRWLPRMAAESRSYVTVGIGCTGGQHRSVYMCERLAQRLQNDYSVLVRHRQLISKQP